ncbi:hypothetical protein [uncultured Rhodoblastus sp.]|uniref:hypothetical protein n=1 Tax=uncultured Rhodoblastus sp. TaxID=543037 RepID=UPI0025CC497C|nr:hypothetical protein [uncultured Rhodoblastus sp.]
MIKRLKLIDEDVIAALLFMVCRHALLLFVAIAGLGGFAVWAEAISEKSLFIAVKAAFFILVVSWTISLVILLARRLAWAECAGAKSCLAIKRAQEGIPESGLCLCRKHGMYWGDGAISDCAHRAGENCVFPSNA